MTVYARYCNELVEVTDVYEGSARRLVADIKAVSDWRKPWTVYSMGGPVETNSITVPVGLLRPANADECTCQPDTGEVCDACIRYQREKFPLELPY